MKNYYLPREDQALVLWLLNFSNKLGAYATKYGIATAEVTDITNGANYLSHWLNVKNQLEEFNKRLTQFKEELKEGVKTGGSPSVVPTLPTFATAPTAAPSGLLTRVRAIANRIKANAGYTEADGKDLGIIGEEVTLDLFNIKPNLSYRLKAGHPEIVWKKQGMDGIHFYVDRLGDGNFTFLARDSSPNYVDNFTLPATPQVWAYKAIYVKNDEEVGQVSDVLSVAVNKVI